MDIFTTRPTYEDLLERIQALEEAVFKTERRAAVRQDVPQEISEAWDAWSKYRQGKGWTAAAKSINAKKLMSLSGGDSVLAVKIVEQSVERGWTGLFPIKEQTENSHAKPKLTPAERTAVNIALNNGGEIPSGYENNRDVVAEVERNLRSQVGVGLRNGRDLLGSADVGEGIKWLNGGTGR